MQRRTKDGFSILLPEADTVQLFGEKLKISRITTVTQAHCRLHPILNLWEKLDVGTPSVIDTTNREVAAESLQFGRSFPRILRAVWEADLAQGPVRVSKLDVNNVYHRSTVAPSQVGSFAYVLP